MGWERGKASRTQSLGWGAPPGLGLWVGQAGTGHGEEPEGTDPPQAQALWGLNGERGPQGGAEASSFPCRLLALSLCPR